MSFNQQPGLIYVMRAGQRVKIGWCAGNAEKRRAELQTGCPDRLEVIVVFPGTRAEEAECHRRFARDRCDEGGQEWFRLSEDLAWLGFFTPPSFVQIRRARRRSQGGR